MIEFIGSTETNSNTAGTFVTVAKPTGTLPGDFLYMVWLVNANRVIEPPEGWSVWTQVAGVGVSYAVFYKFAGPVELDPLTFSVPNGRYQVMLSTYRGVDTESPLDVPVQTSSGTSSLVQFPFILPQTPGAVILATRVLQVASGVSMGMLSYSTDNMILGNFTYSSAGATANQSAANARLDWSGSGFFRPNLVANVVFNQNRAVVGVLRPAPVLSTPLFRGWGMPA